MWEIFKFGSNKLSVNIVHPVIAYTFIYVTYFTIGGLIRLGNLQPPTYLSLMIVYASLLSFIGGYYFARKYSITKNKIIIKIYNILNKKISILLRMLNLRNKLRFFLGILIITSEIGIIIYMLTVGIPIIENPSAEIRHKANVLKLFFVLYSISMGFFIIHKIDNIRKMKLFLKQKDLILRHILLLIIIAQAIIILSIPAYRTLILFFGGCIFLYFISGKRINILYIFLVSIIVFLMIAYFTYYRDVMTYGEEAVERFLRYRGLNPSWKYWIYGWLTMRGGACVFSDLVDYINKYGFFSLLFGKFHGKFYETVFITLFPGKQPGPRTLISAIRGTRLSSTTTPTILGGVFLDFGIVGTVSFSFLLGYILTKIYKFVSSIEGEKRSQYIYVYCLTLIVVLIDIHSGLLDGPFILSILLAWLFVVCTSYPQHKKEKYLATILILVLFFIIILLAISFVDLVMGNYLDINDVTSF